MAGVDTKHPDYVDREREWKLMRDSSRGEQAIKDERDEYLPIPSGFSAAANAEAMYCAYLMRAQFPTIVSTTIAGMVGIIHRKETKIEMPEAMQPLWESATPDGLPLEALHRRITAELLEEGRFGLLVDAEPEGSDLPWLAGYSAESIINWSEERDFFVLDESGLVRDGFNWNEEKRFRELQLVEGAYQVRIFINGEEPTGEGAVLNPSARGGERLTEIPFVVMGAKDLAVAPEDPPLLGVARSAVAIYQLSADYRWQLFMTGQETLVIINGDAPSAVGAAVVISLKGEQGVQPDAKYVGPSGTGIGAHRQAIEDEREAAVAAGARLFDSSQKAAESGEALKLRYAAQTATLVSIAQASAAGLEAALKHMAVMIGADPGQVIVTPDLTFLQSMMNSQDAVNLLKLWQDGAISYETFYDSLQKGQIASSERTAEEERELIDQEDIQNEPDPDDMGFIPPGPIPPAQDPNALPAAA